MAEWALHFLYLLTPLTVFVVNVSGQINLVLHPAGKYYFVPPETNASNFFLP